MNILLFGPPGAGKGTQSELLIERQGMFHVSTGDLFRSAIKNQSELGQKAKSFMDQGRLVPDEIVIGMVEEALDRAEGRGFILDGFPRTQPQAVALEKMLSSKGLTLDKAVFLEVESDLLVRRLTGRRVCKSCGAVYHIENKPTTKDGVCDACGGEVYQRSDDNEEVIRTRLNEYENSTSPLKDFYKKSGCFVSIDGTGGAEAVFDRVKKLLN